MPRSLFHAPNTKGRHTCQKLHVQFTSPRIAVSGIQTYFGRPSVAFGAWRFWPFRDFVKIWQSRDSNGNTIIINNHSTTIICWSYLDSNYLIPCICVIFCNPPTTNVFSLYVMSVFKDIMCCGVHLLSHFKHHCKSLMLFISRALQQHKSCHIMYHVFKPRKVLVLVYTPWRIHGAAIYGVPWIPWVYPLYVSIYIYIYIYQHHGSYGYLFYITEKLSWQLDTPKKQPRAKQYGKSTMGKSMWSPKIGYPQSSMEYLSGFSIVEPSTLW